MYSELEVWLIRLDVRVSHGRAHHPETQGKVERMNRTLPDELPLDFEDLAAAEGGFGLYRPRYNEERPHEALEMTVPASRYAPSERRYPEQLPSVEVPDVAGDVVRQLDGLTLIDLGSAASEARAPASWGVVMSLAWVGWFGLLVVAIVRGVLGRRPRPLQ